MAFEQLPTNYTEATWTGLRKYRQVNNADDTVSFRDVTEYLNKENSFFGAKDANRMNEALNYIMAALENGTNLYVEFLNYFMTQRDAFDAQSDEEYERQRVIFNSFMDSLRNQLTTNQAGNLQNQVDRLVKKTDGFANNTAKFSADGKTIEETDGLNKIITEFVSDKKIVQRFYENGITLKYTKTIIFEGDGSTVKEVVI